MPTLVKSKHIGTERETFGFFWPTGFQTVFCGVLTLLQRRLGAAKTVRSRKQTGVWISYLTFTEEL